LDKAFFDEGGVKPFFNKPKSIQTLNEYNWSSNINPGIKARMDFIESTFKDPNDLEYEVAVKLVDELTVIHKSYDALVEIYEANKPKIKEKELKFIKEMSFYMRSWISDYTAKILPNNKTTLIKGTWNDSPKTLSKDFLED
jgi:hypothetical protein